MLVDRSRRLPPRSGARRAPCAVQRVTASPNVGSRATNVNSTIARRRLAASAVRAGGPLFDRDAAQLGCHRTRCSGRCTIMASPSARSADASRNFTTGRGCDGATSTRAAAPARSPKKLGCHRGTVVKALHHSRITLRAEVRFRQLRDRGWLRRRYVIEGKTPRAIATEVGCQPSTATQALRRARIKPRRRRRPSPSQLRTDWQRYGTINSIAALHGSAPLGPSCGWPNSASSAPTSGICPATSSEHSCGGLRRRRRSPITSE